MPWLFPIVIALAIGFGGGWMAQDWRFTAKIEKIASTHAKEKQELADRALLIESTYRQMEKDARRVADLEREKNREKVAAVESRLAATLVELRKRPERNTAVTSSAVPGETPACAGVSGAELARGDGEFLARYGADAKKLNAALDQCIAQYNAN